MTPFVSVALIRRNGAIIFKPPRKERPDDLTQARKAATRHWRAVLASDDKLVKVIVMREVAGKMEVSERGDIHSPWTQYTLAPARAAKEPHLAASLAEIGVDPNALPPPMPDMIVINGETYRRVQ